MEDRVSSGPVKLGRRGRAATNEWKVTPTSVRNTSALRPVKAPAVTSRTLPRKSQARRHGSVLIRANASSSFFGLKSPFFCLPRACER